MRNLESEETPGDSGEGARHRYRARSMGLNATATTVPETREGATDAIEDCRSENIGIGLRCTLQLGRAEDAELQMTDS